MLCLSMLEKYDGSMDGMGWVGMDGIRDECSYFVKWIKNLYFLFRIYININISRDL